jgi:hypothetical protein
LQRREEIVDYFDYFDLAMGILMLASAILIILNGLEIREIKRRASNTALLAEAVTCYRDALRVHTEADHPLQWALTKENLALTKAALADHAATDDPVPHLRAALTHVTAALTIFDPVHTSYNHEKASRLRDSLRARLADFD